uniref:DUF1995 domain-containing protein n=1 Tax=Florenciella parvula TaxID=236787 RepID=A0A7S2FWU4_9STRA
MMEIEFPPLPTDFMESPECSAYDVSSANVRLAIDFAKSFATEGKRVAIMFPDRAESDRAIETHGADEPFTNIILRPLAGPAPGTTSSPVDIVMGLFGKQGGRNVNAVPDADMYICLVFSAQELPDLEALHMADPSKPLVMMNLKLDTLRGDLGLPAFPPKDLQYRFLSQVLPVYYLRTRTYSKSITKPPFLVNYQGALFRAFPGGWQSMLDVGGGKYRRVKLADERPALGVFKVDLGEALDLGDEGKVNTFFRQGYKTSTWWEDAKEEELHSIWRS